MGVPRIEDDTTVVWLDLETTDLLDSHPDILELGIVLTRGKSLDIIDQFQVLTHNPELGISETRERTAEVPRDMHRKSGLWEEHSSPQSTVLPYPRAEQLALEFLSEHQVSRGILGGASITFDRTMLSWHMPQLLGALSYRSLDISSLAMFMSTVVGDLPFIGSNVPHRAIGDLRSNIYQMRIYQDMVQEKPAGQLSAETHRELYSKNPFASE